MKRTRWLEFSGELLVEMLKEPGHHARTFRVVRDALPDDAVFIGAMTFPEQGSVRLYIQSASWDAGAPEQLDPPLCQVDWEQQAS